MREAIPVGLDIPKPIFTGQSVGQMEGAFWGALWPVVLCLAEEWGEKFLLIQISDFYTPDG